MRFVLKPSSDDEMSWFRSNGIGEIELAQLGEMLAVASYDDLMDGFDELGEFDDSELGNSMAQPIPASLTERLASIDDKAIEAVAKQWATIDEFGGDEDPALLLGYLRRLRSFLDGRTGSFFLIQSL